MRRNDESTTDVMSAQNLGARNLTNPDQRHLEVAQILAAAIVRLRLRAALPGVTPEDQKTLESDTNRLELSGGSRLSVCHAG
jgi:ferric-dicitrate binding protein FerR (iron transport regulator)